MIDPGTNMLAAPPTSQAPGGSMTLEMGIRDWQERLDSQAREIERLHKLLADANRGAQRNAKINQSLSKRVVKLTAAFNELRALIIDHNDRCERLCRWRKENCAAECVECRVCPMDYIFDLPHGFEQPSEGGAA